MFILILRYLEMVFLNNIERRMILFNMNHSFFYEQLYPFIIFLHYQKIKDKNVVSKKIEVHYHVKNLFPLHIFFNINSADYECVKI